MMWLNRLVLAFSLTLPVGSTILPAQDTAPAEPSYEFFSGNVVQSSDNKITVARNVLGHTENRDFLITAETKIEGKLKMKARVTVGFKTSDAGDVAVRIIVRNGNQKK